MRASTRSPAMLSSSLIARRERAAGMYAVLPFGIASGLVELPYLVLQTLVFGADRTWMRLDLHLAP